MDIRKYESAFVLDADFLEKINLELGEIEEHHIKKILPGMIIKMYQDGMVKRDDVFRFRNRITGEILELDKMENTPGFVFMEKIIRLSLYACKRG